MFRGLLLAMCAIATNGCISATVTASISKSGDANNSTNGGCHDTQYTSVVDQSAATGINLVDIQISQEDFDKAANGADALKDVGGFCIDSITTFNLYGTIDKVAESTLSPDSCQGVSPEGNITIQQVTITDNTSNDSTTIACPDPTEPIDSTGASLNAGMQDCLNTAAADATATEIVRKAINAKHTVTVSGVGSCDAGSCFNIAYTVKAHFVAVVKDGGCKS